MRTLAIALFALAGCIDEYRGSELQIDLSAATPVQASPYRAAAADELPTNIHFTLYAFDEMPNMDGTTVGRLFALQQFEIHRVVDLDSPCYIDVGEHVPFPGLHVSQYAQQMMEKTGISDLANPPPGASEEDKIDAATAVQRQRNVALMAGESGPKAVTSVSAGGYGPVATDCNDASAIPPPTCVDAASNQRRLEKCTAEWRKDPALFEGTDRVLTAPLNGTTYGMVAGMNPVNFAPIGGAAFFVDESLADFDGYAVYWQYDDANGDGMPDYPSSVPASERNQLGKLYLFGRPEKPTRGVIHVDMKNPEEPAITAELAIFADIHQDTVHF